MVRSPQTRRVTVVDKPGQEKAHYTGQKGGRKGARKAVSTVDGINGTKNGSDRRMVEGGCYEERREGIA